MILYIWAISVSATNFANVNTNGNANYNTATNSNGVRPDFLTRFLRLQCFGRCRKEKLSIHEVYGMVNTGHDVNGYDQFHYSREIFDGEILYKAYQRARKNASWKMSAQRFDMTYLISLSEIQEQLRSGTYQFHDGNNFIMYERGKKRFITGECIEDRIVKHAMCDEVIVPCLRRYLIYDNGASLEDKGMDFTRRRLVTHLSRYYRENKSNDGYILLVDFSKYYDNIRHDILMDIFKRHIDDQYVLSLVQQILKRAMVDVSYMDDKEYADCMDEVFDSLSYQNIDKNLLTGTKWMPKHMNIGDQVAQAAGISYPMDLDNYIKIVRGVKYYARYMDDSYIIHRNKEYLKQLLSDINEYASNLGITINQKKTRIVQLTDYWRFLKVQYSLTSTGRIVQKINPQIMTRMRRKMKKRAPHSSQKEFHDWFNSWYQNYKKYMSSDQESSIFELYNNLVRQTVCTN